MKESGMDIKQEVNYHNNKKIGRWEKSRGVRERITEERTGLKIGDPVEISKVQGWTT